MAENLCPQCKAPNRATAQFCAECGTPLLKGVTPSDRAPAPPSPPAKTPPEVEPDHERVLQNRYRIERPLGRGGFGSVYYAWDLNLDRPCAIKENLASNLDSQRQFLREATVMSNLSHPNLPRVIDHFIIPDQGQYLVMDYVEGDDLESILKEREVVETGQALDWIIQVAGALDYLHRQHPPVFHRDIKPANIRITPRGQAMLVDFGLVKVFEAQGATAIGARAITPGYAPPEQYGRGGTDARTDIYALGATLYELVTGHEPLESVRRMAGEHQPSAHTLNPAVPIPVSEAIECALALDPAARFQNAADFQLALLAGKTSLDQMPAGRDRATIVVDQEADATLISAPVVPPTRVISTPLQPTEKMPESQIGAPGFAAPPERDMTAAELEPRKRKPMLWIGIAAAVILLLCLATGGGLAALLFGNNTSSVDKTLTARSKLAGPVEATLTARAVTRLATETQTLITPTLDQEATRRAAQNATLTAAAQTAAAVSPTPESSPTPSGGRATEQARTVFLAQFEDQGRLVYGPKAGRLLHKAENGFIETISAGIGVRNFIAEVVFVNPFSAEEGTWDFGLIFRHGGPDVQYRLVFMADKSWILTSNVGSADGIEVMQGEITGLKTDAGESNKIHLYAIENRGYLYFNDQFVAEFDLSQHYSGGVMLGIGFYAGAEKTGKLTDYKDFTVWSIATQP